MPSGIDDKSYQDYLALHRPGIWLEIENSLALLPGQVRVVPCYALKNQGKYLRGCLLLLVAGIFTVHPRKAYPLAAAVELAHAASLLHDDIEDNAGLRRGKTSSHAKFGVKGALLAGDALLSLALHICARGDEPLINRTFASAVLDTVNGQSLELAGHRSQEDYFKAILKKTGGLMGAACEMGGILAGRDAGQREILRELGRNLGAAYQLADDWRDFLPSELTGKDQGQDILKGNITLPFRLFLDTMTKFQQNKLLEQIRQGALSRDELKEICDAALTAKLEAQVVEQINFFLNIAENNAASLPVCLEKAILEQIILQISRNVGDIICRRN